MFYSFLMHMLRNLTATVLLLQPHAFSNAAIACSEPQCVYLPIISNSLVITINEIKGWGGKYGRSGAFGEVINNSNFPVYNVVVQATFIGLSGIPQSSTNTTFLTATLPGQANPFSIASPDAYGALVASKVLSWDITPTISLSNLTVVTLSNYLEPSNPPIYRPVTGTLRNDTNTTLKDIQLYVWNVKSVGWDGQVISRVSPGDTVTFSAAFGQGVPPTDTIHIVAQGVVSP